MGMGMELRLRLLCMICDQDMDDHADNCPQGQMQRLSANRIIHKCPDCHKWSLEKNRGDHLECRECHEVFTLGYGAGYDVDTLPHVIIFTNSDEALTGARFPEKGDGDFPIDVAIKRLGKAVDRARAKAEKKNRGAK